MDYINFENEENEENIIETIDFYEKKISSNDFNTSHFSNLAFIYWALADGEIATNKELSLLGDYKYDKIINQGLVVYPASRELHFWKKYFPYRLFGKGFSLEECNEIIEIYEDKADENNLVPFFFLNFFDEKKYINELKKLKDICLKEQTLKNKYILEFI